MKPILIRILAAGLLIAIGSLPGCHSGNETRETETASMTESRSISESVTDQATIETKEETVVEPVTDAVYPDGETNPDWPYSPGV